MAITSQKTLSNLREKYNAISPYLNERTRRIWVANEAKSLGHGGKNLIRQATGLSYPTIRKGIAELGLNISDRTDINRLRKQGGGRKQNSTKDKLLKDDISSFVNSSARGDPESSLLWISKTTRHIASELNKETQRASHTLVSSILKAMGYSLQANKKTQEGKDHPDRDAQFENINKKVEEFQAANQPVISVDTKKKENIGNFKNNGKEYSKKGTPIKVKTHDFIDKELGKVAPYGIYDIDKNIGWVNVGISKDTAQFAVQSIRSWWNKMGSPIYSKAKELMITADCGGSNGNRVKRWKTELQKLANEINITIHVSHFPPGTSKWNKIEHRMLSFITQNWRGRPLIDRATVINLISNTKTKKGLEIKAALDEREYKKGIKVSDKELKKVNLIEDEFHGEWNYRIAPRR
jgi:hypothetical protein